MVNSWGVILDITVALAGAMGLGLIFERLKMSAIMGYLLAGILLGPSMFNLVPSTEVVKILAELGVVLLMFAIGLEFSVTRIKKMGVKGLSVGALQVIFSIAFVAGVALLSGFEIKQSIVFGMIVAMSSTAVVLRILQDQLDLDSIRGRYSLGVLLVQDMALVPLILIITSMSLGEESGPLYLAVLSMILKALGLVALLFILNKTLVPQILDNSALSRNRELPTIMSFILCLSAAWLAHALGISASLGAFVAGTILGETKFNEQIKSDLAPLKTVFVTIFFTSVGLLADFNWIMENILLVTSLSVVLIVFKALVIYVLFRKFIKLGNVLSTAVGLTLAQIGEFSFVLATLALSLDIFDEEFFQMMVSVSIFTLLVAPFLISNSVKVASSFSKPFIRLRFWDAESVMDSTQSGGAEGHVILVGYGPAGKCVHDAFVNSNLETIVIETNPKSVERIRKGGTRAEVGDASRSTILNYVHIKKARAIVITLPDFRVVKSIIRTARSLSPEIVIIARARYSTFAGDLTKAGANVVLDEEEEAGRLLGVASLKNMGLYQVDSEAEGSTS